VIEDAAYFAIGVVLLAGAGLTGWRSWAGPQRDWRRKRGTWVTAQVTSIAEASRHPGPPYVVLPAKLQLSYTIDGHAYSARLALDRTAPGAYTRWQHLEVFVPASNPRRPRTRHEENFEPEHLNGSFLLVVLGLLVMAAGVAIIIHGS
jgi:hypothetical protein